MLIAEFILLNVQWLILFVSVLRLNYEKVCAFDAWTLSTLVWVMKMSFLYSGLKLLTMVWYQYMSVSNVWLRI